ncbi:MAG: RDD family protein [Candidatus Aenigmarchaeota archaeon]|nr:RDD family protein [Candidatus Aenigmarchaeota archaeon]
MAKIPNWWARFWAWLIDAVIILVVEAVILWLFRFSPRFDIWWFSAQSLIFFLYWTFIEFHNNGQSIGKTALKIRTVNENGKKITLEQSAISAFGKSFLIPIDFIVGYSAFAEEKLRLFNKLSRTRVVFE